MRDEKRYTMHGIYIFETFDNLCDHLHLRPSRWLPRIPKPPGLYRKTIVYSKNRETGEETKREELSDFWWSGYDFLFHLVQDEEKHPVLYPVVGQLYEIAAGVYDWIDWSKALKRGDPGFPDTSGDLSFPDRSWTTVQTSLMHDDLDDE